MMKLKKLQINEKQIVMKLFHGWEKYLGVGNAISVVRANRQGTKVGYKMS